MGENRSDTNHCACVREAGAAADMASSYLLPWDFHLHMNSLLFILFFCVLGSTSTCISTTCEPDACVKATGTGKFSA